MTAAYDEFMRQYKMTGSEKADGYSPAAFVGLSKHEREEVFGLLLGELPFAAEWLFYLDPEKALDVAKKEEARSRGDGYSHAYLIQKELVKYTGDLAYQNHMIEDYWSYIDRLKPQVIDAIGSTPANRTSITFFRQVILTEASPSAVASAAIALLDGLAIPRTSEAERKRYNFLRNSLVGENLELKLKALTDLLGPKNGLS